MRLSKKIEVFLEFLIFGVFMGVIEDVIAVSLSTGAQITWQVIGVITLVAIPFAAIGELIVDRIELTEIKKKRR